MLLKKKIFIFDLDGTILENYDAIENSLIYSLNKNNVKINPKNLKKYVGVRLDQMLEKIIPKNIQNRDKLIDKCTRDYRKKYGEIHLLHTKLKPGMKSVLPKLEKKSTLVIASNKPYIYIINILEQFELKKYFSYIFSSENSKRPKPYPAILLDIVRILKVKKKNCIFIGDSIVDVIAGKRARIRTVCIENDYLDKRKLKSYKSCKIIKVKDLIHLQFN